MEIFLAEEYGKSAFRRHEGSIYMRHYGVYLVLLIIVLSLRARKIINRLA